MDPTRFQPFLLADKNFFDTPARLDDATNRFEHAGLPAPPGWQRVEKGMWVVLTPDDVTLPAQGWKVHASAIPTDSVRVVATVWDYCVRHGIAFKFMRGRTAAAITNAKDSHRGSGGKLVTVYPVDEAELAATLTGLAQSLADVAGPYVLSDLRYGDGPLHVRYGAFTEAFCHDPDGEPEPAMRAPDGSLVPDRREPAFRVPDWVPVPEILRASLAARRAGTADFPYDVERPLHFSNGGGVYLATERATGTRVALREARPHAALDRAGADAVARLGNERAILTRLSGLDCVPELRGYHVAGEHHFLVEEFVDGPTLLNALLVRYPYVQRAPTDDDVSGYLRWATDVMAQVERALAAVHERGVRFGDLHPNNILLRDDGRIVLIDFEVARTVDEPGAPTLRAPGFTAPENLSGLDVDRYALESLRLFLLLPLTQLIDRDPAKAVTLAEVAAELFPAASPRPGTGLLPYLRQGTGRDHAAELFTRPALDWAAIRDSLVGGIHASATPDRRDRLFPGGPAQFMTNGVGLRSGAAGVLLALHEVGATVLPEYVNWLVAAARRVPPSLRAGLYDGLHGVALVLDRLGHTDDSLEVLDLARRAGDDVPVAGLLAGRAGIGLTLSHFARRHDDGASAEAASRLGEDLAALLTGAGRGTLRPPESAGLMSGLTGVALLFLHLYGHSGQERHLDLAELALRRDLEHCVRLPDGTTQVRAGSRNLGYLDAGSGGIALVLHEYLRHRENPELAETVRSISASFLTTYVFQPGLLHGRAGVIAMLRHLDETGEHRSVALRHVRQLGWHALAYQGHLAFPGALLQRLSMDLATGSAGVLLALRSAFEERSAAVLPFLDTRSPTAVPIPG